MMPVMTLTAGALFSSCIREAAKNAEADILSCTVDGVELPQTPVITNDRISFYVNTKDMEKVKSLAPEFTLAEGATIDPASGTVRDFTTPQQYTVTSEDGQWTKSYIVSFSSSDPMNKYHFEEHKTYVYVDTWTGEVSYKFDIMYEPRENADTLFWSSGNPGFMIANSEAPAVDYPTAHCDTGYVGKGVKLVTRSTGALGAMFGSPIAAGNLFLGKFEINMGNTLLSTHFGEGVPCAKDPLAVSGWYRYKRGAQMTDKKNKPIEGEDNFDIYASFFEPTEGVPYLDGTNVKDTTSKSTTIIKFGQVPEDQKIADGEWHQFWFMLDQVSGKTIDEKKLRDGKYAITIVLSSSERGAEFIGAVGSTLYADELELYYKEAE